MKVTRNRGIPAPLREGESTEPAHGSRLPHRPGAAPRVAQAKGRHRARRGGYQGLPRTPKREVRGQLGQAENRLRARLRRIP